MPCAAGGGDDGLGDPDIGFDYDDLAAAMQQGSEDEGSDDEGSDDEVDSDFAEPEEGEELSDVSNDEELSSGEDASGASQASVLFYAMKFERTAVAHATGRLS